MSEEKFVVVELITALLLENPDTVMLASMDILVDKVSKLSRPPKTDRRTFVFSIYQVYLDLIDFEKSELQEKVFIPVILPKRDFSIEARNQLREKFRTIIDDMTPIQAARFLGNLVRTWLLNASREYLLCGEICKPDDDRISAIKKYQRNINGLFELNY